MVTPTAPRKDSVQTSDDAFHILRDCRALYLKQLGQLLQEAERIPGSGNALQAFQQAVGDYFDEMVSTRRRSGFEQASGLTASRISLVGESDLELEIRLGEFSSRLMESSGSDLWRVYLRFVTLLNRPDLNTADNPVGPRGIALGLMEFCSRLGEDHEQTLQRVDRLETYFSRNLGVLYDNLNTFLNQRHVETAQPAIVTAPEQPAANNGNNGNAPAASPNPVLALQKSLLGPAGELLVPAGSPAASLLSDATLARLLARLDELEKPGKPAARSATTFSESASQPSLETLIPGLFTTPVDEPPAAALQALRSSDLALPSGAPEAAGIDTLALIFDAIFASAILPEAIKGILASLQIPLLKAAMLDPQFFVDKNHPARRLLDKIGRAALGLPSDVAATHPLCARIQAIAGRARAALGQKPGNLAPHLAELDALIAERDAEVARSAEGYLPLLHQVERRNQATRRSRQVIEQYLAADTPADLANFLRTAWQKVMVVIWMESGEQSAAWREHCKLVKDLLWSVQPKTDMDERKQLAKMLQPMVQHLNAGMARIGMPAAEQAAFLDSCFAMQTAAMRGAATVSSNPPPGPAGDNNAPVVSELEAGQLRLKIFDHPAPAAGSAWLRPPPVRTGSWLRLALPDNPSLCGRLCPGSADCSLLLIANPEWGFAVALHPELLENMLAKGTARVCSADSLFDAAAEKALRQKTRS